MLVAVICVQKCEKSSAFKMSTKPQHTYSRQEPMPNRIKKEWKNQDFERRKYKT